MCISVGIVSDSFSLHLAVNEFTFVPALIWPDHETVTLHGVIHKLSLVDLTGVCEVILSLAMKLPVDEVTIICATLEFESSLS